MKHIFLISSIFLCLSYAHNIRAQESCKVLIPEIDSIYTGKCKKGLAHGKGHAIGVDSYKGKFSKGLPSGKGTYIWANGDKYEGNWANGMRNGEGTLSLKLADKDSIIEGIFDDNKYLGPKPKPPRIITKTSIDRYTIKQTGGIKNRVLIDFLQNGARNTGIINLIITSSKGVETSVGHSIGYEFIEFPVTIRVNYETLNKLKSELYQAIFEFEITEPGDYIVEIHN